MRLFLLSIFIATFGTLAVAFVNFTREGTEAFSNGPWLYIGYFVFMTAMMIVTTLLMQRFGGKRE